MMKLLQFEISSISIWGFSLRRSSFDVPRQLGGLAQYLVA